MIGKPAGFMLRLAGLSAALSFVLGAPHVARAEEVSASSSAAAQALFDEAKRLFQAGDAAAACPKFEESERLEPGIGTKLNLANCYETIGRTASAWILFLEVESDTKRNGQVERQTMAHNRAAALQPKLSHLKVEVPAVSRVPGLAITRDGIQVGSAQWGLPIPVDPGAHVLQATATGKKPWQAQVTVAGNASTEAVSVPTLEDAPVAVTPGEAPAKPQNHTRRTLAYVSLGVGGVGAILGSVFGLTAISKNKQSNEAQNCDGNNCVDSGVSLRNSARSAGNISTVAFAVGGVGIATGLVLLFTEKKEAPAEGQISASAFATPGGAALGLRGSW
jgi:hypothetical protein